MFRFVAPAGAPLEIAATLRSLKAACSRQGKAEESLESLAAQLQAPKVLGASSGRAALFLILKGLHRLRPDRDVVALPAYTCFTVAASVVRAGLRLHPVDVVPETLDFEPSQLAALPQKELLCIITSNLFGLVNDVDRLREIAQSRGAFLVDDAAQALGATFHGYPAGTLGDVGFYSFGRGKALAAMEGGIIVTGSEEIAAAIRAAGKDLASASAPHLARLFFEMVAYAVFLRPRLYWIPNSLPFLKLGTTEFAPGFPVFRLPALVQELLPRLFERLQEMTRVRRENAAALAQALAGNPLFVTPRPALDCQPNYVRFPLLARDAASRNRAVRRLRAAGIGASEFYPGAICDIPGIEKHMAPDDFHRPQAEDLSKRLLTLPTHPYVRPTDLDHMAKVLKRS